MKRGVAFHSISEIGLIPAPTKERQKVQMAAKTMANNVGK